MSWEWAQSFRRGKRLERPKISEKSPILTQKYQFCARKAGKWGSRSQKAHKNADFVLGVICNILMAVFSQS